MIRLATVMAGVGLVLASLPLVGTAVSSAASNTATTLFPLSDGTQLETHALVDCHRATGSCDFTVEADRRTGDGVTGFPNDLRSRQSTDICSTDRLGSTKIPLRSWVVNPAPSACGGAPGVGGSPGAFRDGQPML
jgi:hypothetical protein